MTVLRKLPWLLSIAVVLSLVQAAPAAAKLHDGGVFNTPAPWGSRVEKHRIVRHIERAIDRTPRSTGGRQSRILISTYLLDRKQSVDALVRACRRGVSVRVILDDGIQTRPSKRLIRMLNSDNVRDRNGDGKADRRPKSGPCNSSKNRGRKGRNGRVIAAPTSPAEGEVDDLTDEQARRSVSRAMRQPLTWGEDRSYVKKCQDSCRGKNGNMHSKFFLFSRVKHVRDVVMVSSSNLNEGAANLGWNDLWTMTKRPKSFDAYARIHRQMTNDETAGPGRVEVKDGPYLSRFFPMSGTGMRRDPTLADLRQIRCRGPLGRTKVYVSMFYWKGKRGNYLASRLLKFARKGCEVSVIYGAPSRQMAERLRGAAGRGLIDLFDSRWDANGDGFVETRTHAKYVLVKGRYGNDKKAWRVLTGSQNWVAGSLSRSDETTLNIASRPAYGDYVDNWNDIRRHSRRVPYR